MADTFTILTQRPTLISQGGNKSVAGVEVGMATHPSGIYVEFDVAEKGYSAQIVNAAALGWASIYETVAGLPNVAGVGWGQVQNTAGNLDTVVVITVTSTSGNSLAQLTVPVTQLGPKLHQAQINALHTQLDDAEAL
jgi:hypothetical protein